MKASHTFWAIDSGHDVMISHPEQTAEMLLRLTDPGRG
jgi:hypothetical protein